TRCRSRSAPSARCWTPAWRIPRPPILSRSRSPRSDGKERQKRLLAGSSAPTLRRSGQALRPPRAIPASGKPPSPRRHRRARCRAVVGDGKPDAVALGLPFRDDGDAVAEFDQASRPGRPVVFDRDAPAPKGMAVREGETHPSAPALIIRDKI